MTMKTCTKCQTTKDDTEFFWKIKAKNRRAAECMVCAKKRYIPKVRTNGWTRLSKETQDLILTDLKYFSKASTAKKYGMKTFTLTCWISRGYFVPPERVKV